MNLTELIQDISAPDADIARFAQLAIQDSRARDEIVRQMCCHPHIMVYYHCFYVVGKASQERPDLFYPYWDAAAALLSHPNSYHRDFAFTLLANLTQVDGQNKFAQVFEAYFEHLNDPKFMTGACCLKNSLKIVRSKPELQDRIVALLLDIDRRCTYTDKQKALLKGDVLDILDAVYGQVRDQQGVDAFMRACVGSLSPKTRKKAKELIEKYALSNTPEPRPVIRPLELAQDRAAPLADLNAALARLVTVFGSLADPEIVVCGEWTARQVLAHLAFWHESFARNLGNLAQGVKPTPLRGKLADLNQRGVAELGILPLDALLSRLECAQQVIQANILNPAITLIPYRKGSRDYTPEEHLEIVVEHIRGHLLGIEKAAGG